MGAGRNLGVEEAGSGPLLVLVHGFPFDRRMWAAQLEGLSDIRRVVAVDLAGRGRSGGITPDGASMDAYADDVAATIEALADQQGPEQGAGRAAAKADIVGLSMGGYVALALWRRHPEVIRSLILASTRAGEDSPQGKAARITNAELVRREGTLGLAQAMLPKLLSPAAGQAVADQVRTMFADTPGATAIADLMAMRERPDSTKSLSTITAPALIIRGADDSLMTPEEADLLTGRIPGATAVTIPAAGHLCPLEQPGAFNAALRDFLVGGQPVTGVPRP